jgi:SAM-dependent methyltransferase
VSEAVQSFAGCCAELYELPIVEYLLGQSFHPGGTKLTRQLASAALVSPDCDVLDVACGNGNSARIVAAEFGATVTGCDYSAINLERAVTASRTAQLESRTQFVRGGAEQLPFAPASFDVALCECSLCLFENMDAALAQIRRVLKPGGRIGVSDFFLNAPVPESLDGLLGQVLCVAGAPSLAAYREALEQAGFEYVRVREVNWTLADMIQRIRKRLKLLAATPGAASIDLPDDWGDPTSVLTDLENFIADGGAGYLMATARRP